MSAPHGGSWNGVTSFPATMTDRILQFTRGPNFVGLVRTFAERTDDLINDTLSLRGLFDLNTAIGVRLDEVGKILQRARGVGETDTEYRLLLQIQALLILASQGTTPALLEVVRQFTGVDGIEYAEHHPASMLIGATITDATATAILVDLLRQGKVGGARLVVQVSAADALVMDYSPRLIPGAGLMDYTPDPIVTDTPLSGLAFRPSMETLIDAVGGGTGVEVGTPVYLPADDAREFDGATDRIDWVHPGTDVAIPATLSVWVRCGVQTAQRYVLSIDGSAGNSTARIVVNTDGMPQVYWQHSGTDLTHRSTTPVDDGEWHHIAVAFADSTAANARIYVDGIETAYSTAVDGTATPGVLEDGAGVHWSVGGRDTGGTWFDGDVRDVQVFDRALSATEILQLRAPIDEDAGTSSYGIVI